MFDIHSPAAEHDHNVTGWERVSSLAGGALMASKGMRRGGLIGLLQVTVGGLALARGLKGQCQAKAWLQKQRADYRRLNAEIDRGAAELRALKDSAESATRTVTVTGKDPLSEV